MYIYIHIYNKCIPGFWIWISQDSIQLWASLPSSENHRMITNGAPKRKQTAWACCESTTCRQSTSGTPQRSTFASCSCLCFRNTWYTTEHHQSRSSKKRLLGTSPRSLTSCRETSLPGLCPEPVDHEVFVDGYIYIYNYIYSMPDLKKTSLQACPISTLPLSHFLPHLKPFRKLKPSQNLKPIEVVQSSKTLTSHKSYTYLYVLHNCSELRSP